MRLITVQLELGKSAVSISSSVASNLSVTFTQRLYGMHEIVSAAENIEQLNLLDSIPCVPSAISINRSQYIVSSSTLRSVHATFQSRSNLSVHSTAPVWLCTSHSQNNTAHRHRPR